MDYNPSSYEQCVRRLSSGISTHAPTYEFRIIPRFSGQVNLARIVIRTLCLLIQSQTAISNVFLFSIFSRTECLLIE